MNITVNDIMAKDPCYKRARVEGLWSGRESLTPREIADLNIPPQDRFWALVYCCGMSDRNLRLLACDCAERALSKVENPDPRSVEAIRVSRAYANGEATIEQLREAAWAAESAAAYWAAWAAEEAEESVASEAACAEWAVEEAAWAAAEAEREWQVNRALWYIDGEI